MIDSINLDSLIRGRVDPYIYAFETNTVPNFLKVGDTYKISIVAVIISFACAVIFNRSIVVDF